MCIHWIWKKIQKLSIEYFSFSLSITWLVNSFISAPTVNETLNNNYVHVLMPASVVYAEFRNGCFLADPKNLSTETTIPFCIKSSRRLNSPGFHRSITYKPVNGSHSCCTFSNSKSMKLRWSRHTGRFYIYMYASLVGGKANLKDKLIKPKSRS